LAVGTRHPQVVVQPVELTETSARVITRLVRAVFMRS
jgi:hypothetical protein